MCDCPYCHGDKAVAKIAKAMGFRPDVAFLRIKILEAAIKNALERLSLSSNSYDRDTYTELSKVIK